MAKYEKIRGPECRYGEDGRLDAERVWRKWVRKNLEERTENRFFREAFGRDFSHPRVTRSGVGLAKAERRERYLKLLRELKG